MPCADRIIAARIARVFIGMADPNPSILGKGINKLLGAGIEVGFFDKDLRDTIASYNSDFIDHYLSEEDESQDTTEFTDEFDAERQIVRSANLADLDEMNLASYLKAQNEHFKIPSPELWQYLRGARIVDFDEDSGVYRPTVAGLTLFAFDPAQHLVQVPVMVEAKIGEAQAYDEFSDPLVNMPEIVLSFLAIYMRQFTVIDGLKRENYLEYPVTALREAIVNALVHRSLIPGMRVHVKLLPNRIEVHSPGLPVPPLTVAELQTFEAAPFSRNPHIASAMRAMGYMDERGSGITRMRDALVGAGHAEPYYTAKSGYLILTLPGYQSKWEDIRFEGERYDRLPLAAKEILDLVLSNGQTTSSEVGKLRKTSDRTARSLLSSLIAGGFLERRGAGPSTHYVLPSSPAQT